MEWRNQILHGDCSQRMRELPADAIAACITDPPYNYEFIGHKWDDAEIRRRVERVQASSTLVKHIPYGSGLAGGVRNAGWYRRNRENIREYGDWVQTWGRELYRVLKPGALVFTFNSSRTVAHVQVALENAGFYARDILVWRRHSGIPKGLNFARKLTKMGDPRPEVWEGWHSCLRSEWEAVSVVQKPLVGNYIATAQTYKVGLFHTRLADGGFQSNILDDIRRDADEDGNAHVTVKPLALIRKLITMSVPRFAENAVIDPFLGSGTTAVAAAQLGVDFVGIEIEAQYIRIAQERLQRVSQEKETASSDGS